MILATVSNVGPIIEAKIPIRPGVNLLSGLNKSGKSCFSLALAVALARPKDLNPKSGELLKQDGKTMVRHGQPSGFVKLEDDQTGWKFGIAFPSFRPKVDGGDLPLAHHPVAVGIQKWMEMTPTDRFKMIQDVVPCNPSLNDFTIACQKAGVSDDGITIIFDSVCELGWDAVHRNIITDRAKAKGRWEQVTKVAWGDDRATTWKPPGWDGDLDITIEQMAETVKKAADHHIDLVKRSTVSEVRIDDLRQEAEKKRPDIEILQKDVAEAIAAHTASKQAVASMAPIPPPEQIVERDRLVKLCLATKPDLVAMNAAVTGLHRKLDAAMVRLYATTVVDADKPSIPCPACKVPLVVIDKSSGKFVLERTADTNRVDPAKAQEMRIARDSAEKEVSQLEDAVKKAAKKHESGIAEIDKITQAEILLQESEWNFDNLEDRMRIKGDFEEDIWKCECTLGNAQMQLQQAKAASDRIDNAAAKLAEIQANPREVVTQEMVDDAKNILAAARLKLQQSQTYLDALELSGKVFGLDSLSDLLSPSGLRKTAMDKVFSKLRDLVTHFSCGSGYMLDLEQLRISTTLNGLEVPWSMMSGADRYTGNVVMQLVIAHLSASSMIICDGADIAIGPGRTGLIGMLLKSGITSLVTMSQTEAEYAAVKVGPKLHKFRIVSGVAVESPAAEEAAS